jgi:hypothetical protein
MAKTMGAAAAILMVLAPLLVLALDPLTSRLDQGGLFGMLHLWADIVRSEGLKLVTGHGFDTAARALAAAALLLLSTGAAAKYGKGGSECLPKQSSHYV